MGLKPETERRASRRPPRGHRDALAYLLGRMGLLRQDRVIADTVHFVGVILFIASCLWGLIFASAPAREAPAEAGGPASPP